MDSGCTSAPAIRRAAIANLGCKVNQSEMDAVEVLLRARGVEIVDPHQTADLVVVNTCTVTSIADRKSRQAVRRARRSNPDTLVLVTGCSVAVGAEALAAVDPAARLYDNESKARLLDELPELLATPDGRPLPTLSGVDRARPRLAIDRAEPDESEESGEDGFTEAEATGIDRTRAFVKIQDGCSFHCTYCIIPRARGPERSVPAKDVLAEVRRALAAGHREVVLTGINAGSYSNGGAGLPDLVRRILDETPIERIRLSSIEPQHLTGALLRVWVESGGRCLPHFHVPLQAGDDTILRRMGRRYLAADYRAVVARVREAIPGVAIHADVIVGFPGEEEAAFGRTAQLLEELSLAGVHVFRYSSRPGTPAARMMGQIDGHTKKRRAAELLELSARSRARFATEQLGRALEVLFERQEPDGRWIGHAQTHVRALAVDPSGGSLDNQIGVVRASSIDPAHPDRVEGELISVR